MAPREIQKASLVALVKLGQWLASAAMEEHHDLEPVRSSGLGLLGLKVAFRKSLYDQLYASFRNSSCPGQSQGPPAPVAP